MHGQIDVELTWSRPHMQSVRSSHYTDVSIHPHPAQPLIASVLMPPTREDESYAVTNYKTEIHIASTAR